MRVCDEKNQVSLIFLPCLNFCLIFDLCDMKKLFENRPYVISFAGLVLLSALSFGYFLSTHKPLENDELFTQIHSVEGLSYRSILTMKIPEGNVSPLFYLTQKVFLDVIHFRLPLHGMGHGLSMMCRPKLFCVVLLTFLCLYPLRWYFISLRGFILWERVFMGHWLPDRPI